MLKLINFGLCLIITFTTGNFNFENTINNFNFENELLNTSISKIIKHNIETDLFPTRYEEVNLSLLDFEFMARVVAAEAGLDNWNNQVAVAQVIWNRVNSDQFENTVYNVLTEKGQFSTVKKGKCKTETNDQCRDAIVYAYINRPIPSDVLFFRSGHYFKGLKKYEKIGDNYFSYG